MRTGTPRRQRERRQRPRPPPGRAHRLRGRRGVRELGRQGAPDRGRVGARRPRRSRRGDVRLGRRALSRRAGRWPTRWQGEFPWQNLELDGYEGTSPVGQLPAERLRPVRHDRERLGVDDRPLRGTSRRGREPLLRSRAASTRGDDPETRDQGRLASLRARTTACATAPPRARARRSTRRPRTSASAASYERPSARPLGSSRVRPAGERSRPRSPERALR